MLTPAKEKLLESKTKQVHGQVFLPDYYTLQIIIKTKRFRWLNVFDDVEWAADHFGFGLA